MIEALDMRSSYVAHVGVYAELHGFIFRLLKLLGMGGLPKLIDFTVKQIQDRLSDLQLQDEKLESLNFFDRVLRPHQEEPTRFTMAHAEHRRRE